MSELLLPRRRDNRTSLGAFGAMGAAASKLPKSPEVPEEMEASEAIEEYRRAAAREQRRGQQWLQLSPRVLLYLVSSLAR